MYVCANATTLQIPCTCYLVIKRILSYLILNNFANGVLICSTICLSSFGGIPSTPGDLLSFIFFIFFAIISGVTNNCLKCSDLLPSNLVNGTGSELISSVVKT